MSALLEIRDPAPADEAAWRMLWAGYCGHYRAAIPAEITDATWARLLRGDPAMHARVAVLEGCLVGFAHVVLHASTWRTGLDAYLEDLFVAALARRRGVARALMDDLIARCRAHGWHRLSWHTNSENARARALYDSYGPVEGVVRYRLLLG